MRGNGENRHACMPSLASRDGSEEIKGQLNAVAVPVLSENMDPQ
jgi:hypothetical protein